MSNNIVVITRNGRVKDFGIKEESIVRFAKWSERKKALTPYGNVTFKWIMEHFEKEEIKIFYKKGDEYVLVIEVDKKLWM